MREIFPNKSNNCLNKHALLKILVFQSKNVHVFQTVTEVSLEKKNVCFSTKNIRNGYHFFVGYAANKLQYKAMQMQCVRLRTHPVCKK